MTTSTPKTPFLARCALVAVCVVGSILSALSCSKRSVPDARRLLDGLPPEFVRHLTAGDDSALARFARTRGFETLHGMNSQIGRRKLSLWAQGRREDTRAVEAYEERLARAFSTVYGDDSYLAEIAFLRSLTDEDRDAVTAARQAHFALQTDPSLSPQEALEVHTRYARIFDALGDRAWAAMCKLNVSDAYDRLGEPDRQKEYLIAACTDFQELGKGKLACEALGRLGWWYETHGLPDSMAICYDKALEIAYRRRMGYQAARIIEFYGNHYGRLGRLDVKRRLLDEAMEVARLYDPGCYEVRFLKEAMKFHTDLGCWEVVENLVTRVRGLERECKGLELFFAEVHLLRTDVYEARLRMASGDTAWADRVLRDVNKRLLKLKLPPAYRAEDDEYAYHRATGLLANGRAHEALEEARRKLSEPPEESVPLWSARLSILAAEAAYRTGQFDAARQAVASFDRFAAGEENALRTERSDRDAIVGAIAFATGDTAGAVEAVAVGLKTLREAAASIDASIGSYLWLTNSEGLRQTIHDIAAHDAAAGYGAELCWRELYELLGANETPPRRDTAAAPTGGALLEEFRSAGRLALEEVSRIGAVHCVYLVRGEDIWRWTASRGGVRREVLNASVTELRHVVASTRKTLSTYPSDADSPVDEPLRNNLRALARTLLPPEVLDPHASFSEPPVFLVTGDKFLDTVPFETFDVGPGDDYQPLLARRDVAYVRRLRAGVFEKARGQGVILVNQAPSQGLRGAARPLEALREVEEEARTLAALDPKAVLLSGEAATKKRLTQIWETAPYVYIATHTVHTLPYLAAIILAEPADDPAPDAAVLDVTDIRSADLRRCGIVVLSGCSSGSPYAAARGNAPSLADAFLDAGARAVVRTFWDVEDENARRIATSFINRWKIAKAGEVRALADARRAELVGPRGIRHPSRWAAYAITISRL